MPSRPTLAAASRDVTGKRVSQLRRTGRLPAVVFGHGVESAPVSIDAHEFDALRRSTGPNALVDLSIDGGRARPVLIHGIQAHPVTRRPLHADLFVVRMTEELTVDVPLVPTGHSEAVATYGGTLLHVLEHVKVRALPDHLPQAIEYALEPLVDFDATVHVADLAIPSGVTLLTEPSEIVAKVLRSRVEEAVEAAPAEAAEAGAEAEAAPAAAPVAGPEAEETSPAES